MSGNFPNKTQPAIERDYIVPLGATLSKTITQLTTHLIATETDFAKPSAKVKQAHAMQLAVVSFDWLEECLAQTTRLAEASYRLGSTAGSANGNGTGTSVAGSRKRAASVASDDSQAAPQPKKKVANTTSKKAATASQASSSKAPDLKLTVCIICPKKIHSDKEANLRSRFNQKLKLKKQK